MFSGISKTAKHHGYTGEPVSDDTDYDQNTESDSDSDDYDGPGMFCQT